MPREATLSRIFVELADTLVADFDVVDFMTILTDGCIDVLDVGAAGLMLVAPGGDLRVMAASSEAVRLLELVELQAQQGPCLDCYRTGQPVVNHDLADGNGPWPVFTAEALAAGFRSVHALPMRLRGSVIGALNLLQVHPRAMREADVVAAQAMADVATIAILQHRAALEARVLNDQLTNALNSRVVIEQAKGMVAERLGIDVQQAFAALRGARRRGSRGWIRADGGTQRRMAAATRPAPRQLKGAARRRARRRERVERPGQPTERPRVDPRFAEYRRTNDSRLRDELVVDHRWVAVHCARRFTGKGEPTDDLTQVAMLGLIKAVQRFDPEYGVVFTTFAIPSIVGELRRHFRDKTWAVHVPRRAKELHQLVNDAAAELSHLLGRSPTIPEIASHAGITVEDTLNGLEAGGCYRGVPLTPPSEDGAPDGLPIGKVDPGFEATEARLTVTDVIDVLPERERLIVKLRFVDRLTQSQIADQIGVSQVQVSRLLRASLEKMRRKLSRAEARC